MAVHGEVMTVKKEVAQLNVQKEGVDKRVKEGLKVAAGMQDATNSLRLKQIEVNNVRDK